MEVVSLPSFTLEPTLEELHLNGCVVSSGVRGAYLWYVVLWFHHALDVLVLEDEHVGDHRDQDDHDNDNNHDYYGHCPFGIIWKI